MLVFQAINAFARATPWLHGPMLVYTNYGIVLFALLLLSGWGLARQQASPRVIAAAVWAPIGMLAALGINQPIASAVGEARPYTALHNILVLVHQSKDPSFPSDHATAAFAIAFGILFVARRSGWLFVACGAALLAVAETWSLREHYGWPLTVFWVLLVAMLGLCAVNTAARMQRSRGVLGGKAPAQE